MKFRLIEVRASRDTSIEAYDYIFRKMNVSDLVVAAKFVFSVSRRLSFTVGFDYTPLQIFAEMEIP